MTRGKKTYVDHVFCGNTSASEWKVLQGITIHKTKIKIMWNNKTFQVELIK